jgi:hypothetical protein
MIGTLPSADGVPSFINPFHSINRQSIINDAINKSSIH